MIEIALDKYLSKDSAQMVEWCQRHLAPRAWKIKFLSSGSVAFEFKRSADAVAFSQQWKQHI